MDLGGPRVCVPFQSLAATAEGTLRKAVPTQLPTLHGDPTALCSSSTRVMAHQPPAPRQDVGEPLVPAGRAQWRPGGSVSTALKGQALGDHGPGWRQGAAHGPGPLISDQLHDRAGRATAYPPCWPPAAEGTEHPKGTRGAQGCGRGVLSQTAGSGHHSAAHRCPSCLVSGRDRTRTHWDSRTEGCRGWWGPWAGGHPRARTHHMPFAGQWDEAVAAFMDQQFAVDAPVALPRETPYPFAALATVGSLRVRGRLSGWGPGSPKPLPH